MQTRVSQVPCGGRELACAEHAARGVPAFCAHHTRLFLQRSEGVDTLVSSTHYADPQIIDPSGWLARVIVLPGCLSSQKRCSSRGVAARGALFSPLLAFAGVAGCAAQPIL